MPSLKSTIWSRRQLLPALLFCTIVYQLVFNSFLLNSVQQDASQDACSASPGVGNADSPHCLEVRLFRSWQEREISNAEEGSGLLRSAVTSNQSVLSEVVTVSPRQLTPNEEQSAIQARMSRRHELMDKVEKQIRASLNQSSNTTPWAQDLMALQEHLTSEMNEQDTARQRKVTMNKIEKAVQHSLNSSAMTPWAKELVALQEHLQEEVGAEARHHRHLKRKANITQEISERMTTLETHLAHMVAERKVWEAKLVKQYGAPPPHTTAAPRGFLEKRLSWSSVAAWSKTSWRPKPSWHMSVDKTSGHLSVALRHDLRHLHWSGAIPKVACITGIHGERHTKARMMYFINNFRLQDYEGPRQLLLMYHHSDEEAAQLVRSYADGSYIKGVATHGENVFPSASALRYGAWSSDADVIARWDFEEWHDPSRLSMQIRALAMSSRPASILRHPTATEDHPPGATSLVGEKSWMDKHWHPFLQREQTVLEWTQADHVVKVDMQNERLANNISHIKEAFSEAHLQDTKVTTTTELAHSYDMSECLDFDTSNHSISDGHHVEQAIVEDVGTDMASQFGKLMTKRHDITQKLQLLCLESVLEKDQKKQVFMRQHVDQMAGIRAELDKHIAGMTTLFEGSQGTSE